MRKLIVVFTVVAAPLVAAAPAAVVADVAARDGLAHPPPPLPPRRPARPPRRGSRSRRSPAPRPRCCPDITATTPRRRRHASACVGVLAAPSDRVSAGSALARPPPAAA